MIGAPFQTVRRAHGEGTRVPEGARFDAPEPWTGRYAAPSRLSSRRSEPAMTGIDLESVSHDGSLAKGKPNGECRLIEGMPSGECRIIYVMRCDRSVRVIKWGNVVNYLKNKSA
jgi:hypothetical protein